MAKSTRKSLIIIREIQIKITMRYHLTLHRMVITKKKQIFLPRMWKIWKLCVLLKMMKNSVEFPQKMQN